MRFLSFIMKPCVTKAFITALTAEAAMPAAYRAAMAPIAPSRGAKSWSPVVTMGMM